MRIAGTHALLVWLTLASGCAEKGPPSWASECPDFAQHWVPCCSGGQGSVEGTFGTDQARFVAGGGGGFANQAGCTAPLFQLDASARAFTAPAPAHFTLDFRLDATGTPSAVSALYFHADNQQGQLFGNTRVANGQLVPTDFSVQITERRPWHVAGRVTGTLVRDPHTAPVSIPVIATFAFDTVYFEWLPD
jgi:hypothetical protein